MHSDSRSIDGAKETGSRKRKGKEKLNFWGSSNSQLTDEDVILRMFIQVLSKMLTTIKLHRGIRSWQQRACHPPLTGSKTRHEGVPKEEACRALQCSGTGA